MLNTANLSLEQAPPISVPLRFFLTAPLFGLSAGLLLLVYGPEALTTRWAPPTLALVHLLTLGFLAMVMCGAMMQMLPVLVGSPVPGVVPVGAMVHLLLTWGTLSLVAGFLQVSGVWMTSAILSLGGGFTIFIFSVSMALFRVKVPNPTITGMWMAIVALMVTVGFGLVLAAALAGIFPLASLLRIADVHLTWGMLGWVALLLIGVAYQVVPMFQMTPEYPGWVKRWLIRSLLGGMTVWTLLYLGGAGGGHLPEMVPALFLLVVIVGYLLFAVLTLHLQQQRRRRITDVTLLFWRVGLAAMLVSGLLWLGGYFFPPFMDMARQDLLLGVLLILGAGVSLLNGMLYKIVPFLSWFHLQNRQLALRCMKVPLPHMKQFLPDKVAKMQFLAHFAALSLTILAVFFPAGFSRPAGVLWGLSSLLLWINLLRVVQRYRQVNHALLGAAPDAQ